MKTLHEVALQNLLEQGLKVGSKVKVIAKAEEFVGGWNAGWVNSMDKYLGQELKLREIRPDNIGVSLKTPDGRNWNFPAFCLELVQDEEKTEPQPVEVQNEPSKLPPPSERPDLYEPFKLEHALKGRPVVHREGEKAVAFYHIKEMAGTDDELTVVFEGKRQKTYFKDGRYTKSDSGSLFHPKEETQSTWVNIYRTWNGDLACGMEYESIEDAEKRVSKHRGKYIATVEIKSPSKWQ